MVLNWWREVIQGRHTELAPKYQAEDYIQHNPNIATGRAAFVAFFGNFGKPIDPIPAKLSPEPVVSGAKGDLCGSFGSTKTRTRAILPRLITTTAFDIMRIQNGKVQEHWDDAKKDPRNKTLIAQSPGSQSKGSTGTLSKTEQRELGPGH